MGDRILDSLTSVVQQWKEVNSNELLNSILPSENKIEESNIYFQSSKTDLQSITKEFRKNHLEKIPRDDGISLLNQYDKIYSSMIIKSKENDSSLAECYTKLATVDNPSGILQLTSSTIKSIPDFNFQKSEILQEVENERKKGEIASSLLKTLNNLKKESDEQIAVAKKTAVSQSKIDFEVSLSEFQTKLKNAQNSLKSAKLEYNSLSLLKESKANELKSKESDIDMKFSARQEQIETLQNELNDTRQTLTETEKKQEEIEKSGSISELNDMIQKVNSQIDDLDNKANEIRNEIVLKRNERQNLNEKLNQKMNELKNSIDVIEKSLSELPSQSQWSQIKNSYEKVKIINEKQKQKENLQNESIRIENEIEKKKSQLETKNQELSKIKVQYESEKKNINDAIEHFKSAAQKPSSNSIQKTESEKNCELISIIQSQIENLIQSEENNVKYASLLKQQNQLKRSTKETLENEVNQLKKQLKTVNRNNGSFDPENPQLIVSTTVIEDEGDEELARRRKRRRKRMRERWENDIGNENESFFSSDNFKNENINVFCEKASNTVNDLCASSRFFRLSIFIFILCLHLMVLLMPFGLFSKK